MRPVKIVALMLFIGLVITSITPASAWVNTDLKYQTVNAIANGARPYVLNLTISNAVGTSTSTTVYLQGHGQADLDDVRFYLNDITPLNYWTDGAGKFWVNVTGNGNVYIYYGNSSYSSGAYGAGTFIQFRGSTSSAYSNLTNSIAVPFIYETRIKQTVSGNLEFGICGSSDCDIGANGIVSISHTSSNFAGMFTRASSTQTTNTAAPYFTTNTYFNVRMTAISTSLVKWDATGYAQKEITTNIPSTKLGITTQLLSGTAYTQDYAFVRQYAATEPVWTTWGSELNLPHIGMVSFGNNYTNNQQTDIQVVTSYPIRFNVTTNITTDFYTWWVDGVNQSFNANNFNYSFLAGLYNVTVVVKNNTNNSIASKQWNVTAQNFTLTQLFPTNTSTTSNTTPTLVWREWPSNPTYQYEVYTDTQMINKLTSGTGTTVRENSSVLLTGLTTGTAYYWRVKNSTGNWTDLFVFTAGSVILTPGRLNITAYDEKNITLITTFTATLYNSTSTISKSTTNGWTNFTSAEVSSSEYLIRVAATNYAPRYVLATSPANITLYLPQSQANTINTLAFYLLDYTGKFPWRKSKLLISKNNSIMQSSYFDADAKVAAYLIQGDSYKITVSHENDLQEWGNFIPVSSGNVEVTLIDIGVNYTGYVPFDYNITHTTDNITLQWSDAGILNSFNFSIYQGVSKTLVHLLITSVKYGQSEYLVTNTSDVYYVYFTANTTNGISVNSYMIDYRSGTRRSDDGSGYIWDYGSFTAPEWVYTIFALFVLIMMGAGFGAIHSPFGAIMVGIFSLIFMAKGWMSDLSLSAGFLGGLVVYIALYYMQDREKKV